MTLHLREALRQSIDLAAEAKQRIGDAIYTYDNDDCYGRRIATAAYEQDKPAYWTKAKYHSQKATALQVAVHQMPLPNALRFAYGPGADFIAALDTLVPLNEQAAIVLTVQYSEYGVWRDVEELLMRRLRRIEQNSTFCAVSCQIRSPPMADLLLRSSAVISPCLTWRYRLDREVQESGTVFAFFGVNGSTAGEQEEDHTTMKWRGFTLRNGGRKYIAGNPFAFRATDVRELATAADPVGPENARYLAEIIAEADILVPCWGNRAKVPERLRHHLFALKRLLFASGKPVKTFGFTVSGDPKHPLTLGYDTPLIAWEPSNG